jgi:hypothetical protein
MDECLQTSLRSRYRLLRRVTTVRTSKIGFAMPLLFRPSEGMRHAPLSSICSGRALVGQDVEALLSGSATHHGHAARWFKAMAHGRRCRV